MPPDRTVFFYSDFEDEDGAWISAPGFINRRFWLYRYYWAQASCKNISTWSSRFDRVRTISRTSWRSNMADIKCLVIKAPFIDRWKWKNTTHCPSGRFQDCGGVIHERMMQDQMMVFYDHRFDLQAKCFSFSLLVYCSPRLMLSNICHALSYSVMYSPSESHHVLRILWILELSSKYGTWTIKAQHKGNWFTLEFRY